MLTNPNDHSQHIGYLGCLLDINRWMAGQIGKLDHDTLVALADEMDRLTEAMRPAVTDQAGEAA